MSPGAEVLGRYNGRFGRQDVRGAGWRIKGRGHGARAYTARAFKARFQPCTRSTVRTLGQARKAAAVWVR
jgi:hypothetical protein